MELAEYVGEVMVVCALGIVYLGELLSTQLFQSVLPRVHSAHPPHLCPLLGKPECVWFGVNQKWDGVIPNITNELIHLNKYQIG
jgi:hypothetical protein